MTTVVHCVFVSNGAGCGGGAGRGPAACAPTHVSHQPHPRIPRTHPPPTHPPTQPPRAPDPP